MPVHRARRAPGRRLGPAKLGAITVLLTAAVTWLWAHEGHLPLPTRGAVVDPDTGQVNLSPDARAALDVRTAEVRLEALPERLSTPATLVAPWHRRAFVTTRLAGKIAAVRVRAGDPVERGQALAEVESLGLENLQLELRTARNAERVSAREVRRLGEAYASGSVPDRDLEAARSRHQQDRNALEIARLKLLGLGVAEDTLERVLQTSGARPLSPLPITSPIPGVVTRVEVRVGQEVDLADHLFEVVDLSSLWVRAEVLEADLPRVRPGQPVEVRLAALPGKVFRTTVQVKGLSLDPKTRQGTAWAELPNPPGEPSRLLPGMYGQADFVFTTPGKVVTVPAEAVVADGAERYVLVEEGPGQYVRQNVVTGRQAGGRVEVRAGQVAPGDRVVTVGGHELGSFFGHGAVRLSPQAARNIGLRVEPARRGPVAEVLELTGAVELPVGKSAVVSSPLRGTIRRLRVDHDRVVRAGEVLAEVGGPAFQDLQLYLIRNHLRLRLLEQSLDHLRALARVNAVAEGRLLAAEDAAAAARERRDSARRKLEAVGLTATQLRYLLDRRRPFDSFPVKAPIPGVVVRFRAALGHAVQADHPLFEIHDLTRPLVRAFVSEREVPAVRVGQRARVRLLADPAARAEGVVARSGQTFGADDRTLSVWVEPGEGTLPALRRALPALGARDALSLAAWAGVQEERPRWLPGTLARVTLVVSEPGPALAVPRQAVLREGSQTYLFVRRPGGAFDRREITTGRADDRFVAVTSGLREGEEVAVRGVAGLQTAYATIK
jgi:membrane fusion protein, heavy metal efflux system